jgi:hypothetical protein
MSVTPMRRPAFAVASLLVALVVACSSSPHPTPTPSGSACGDGYLAAVNGACPKGTCLEGEASASCCGSQCATCEDKELVSAGEAGACPAGMCVSSDLTEALSCCDTCPGADAAAEAAAESGADAGTEAGSGDAAGDGASD